MRVTNTGLGRAVFVPQQEAAVRAAECIREAETASWHQTHQLHRLCPFSARPGCDCVLLYKMEIKVYILPVCCQDNIFLKFSTRHGPEWVSTQILSLFPLTLNCPFSGKTLKDPSSPWPESWVTVQFMEELGPVAQCPAPNWTPLFKQCGKRVGLWMCWFWDCVCELCDENALSELNDGCVRSDLVQTCGATVRLWALPQKLLLTMMVCTEFPPFQGSSVSPYVFIEHAVLSSNVRYGSRLLL